jgi:hypothetical protein
MVNGRELNRDRPRAVRASLSFTFFSYHEAETKQTLSQEQGLASGFVKRARGSSIDAKDEP